MKRETKLQKRIVNYIKGAGGYVSVYDPAENRPTYMPAGTPDIQACIGGRFFGIELKTNIGTPTAQQIFKLNEIAASGGVALIVNEYSEDALKELIDALTGRRECNPDRCNELIDCMILTSGYNYRRRTYEGAIRGMDGIYHIIGKTMRPIKKDAKTLK